MKAKGLFLVLEGPDKSGKSTHAARLVRELRSRGRRVVHTREPGGTAFAEAVRALLLSPRYSVRPLAELFLYEAARAQHTEEVLLPALRRGAIVVCERYTLATLAYQGFGRRLPLPMVRLLNRIATSGLRPRRTLVLDVPEARFRDRDPGRRLDRLERENSAFRRRVREGYRRLARREPGTAVIDADRPIEDVHAELLRRVEPLL